MMVLLRLVFGLLLIGGAGCFVAYLVTRDPRWRRLGLRLVWVALGAAFVFFAVLIAMNLQLA
ncbi:MAG: hypothetical protein ABIX12_00235 [Rubrivivax sp.]